jgi:hypothetical protein
MGMHSYGVLYRLTPLSRVAGEVLYSLQGSHLLCSVSQRQTMVGLLVQVGTVDVPFGLLSWCVGSLCIEGTTASCSLASQQ